MKMNKKGFTLIEMLVVIAIIAVLVSIIIPTVTSATDKAAAATNAANMRSVKAAVTTAYLANGTDGFTITAAGAEGAGTVTAFPASVQIPDAKVMDGVTSSDSIVVVFDDTTDSFTVTLAGKDIDDFAYFASNGEWES